MPCPPRNPNRLFKSIADPEYPSSNRQSPDFYLIPFPFHHEVINHNGGGAILAGSFIKTVTFILVPFLNLCVLFVFFVFLVVRSFFTTKVTRVSQGSQRNHLI